MSDTYTTWLAKVANAAGTVTTNPFLLVEVPAAIDYAEGRMYRDFNLLTQVTTDSSQTLVPLSRLAVIPSPFFEVSRINIITPAGQLPDSAGSQRNQLTLVSKDYLDFMYPSAVNPTLPTLWARPSQFQAVFGPFPDKGYVVEYEGIQRPAPLSVSNPTTFLTTYIADLFFAATMIHIAGYQKNFGSQSDDPRMAVSWETQYQTLSRGVNAEELRKRYAGTTAIPAPGIVPAPAGAPRAA